MGRCYDQLQEWERGEIFRLRSAGISQAEIGRRLSRDRATISRELRRNAERWGGYQPLAAQRRAERRRRRRLSKIRRLSRLENHIRDHLAMGQSPEQIAGRLKRTDTTLSISHESIYRYIYSSAGRRDRLHKLLAQGKGRRGRRPRLGQSKPLIPDRISISSRPGRIKRRLLFGHWEGDLMNCRRHAVVVLVEQRSRFILAARQDGKKSLATARSIGRLLKDLPKRAKASITFDNGGEFARHRLLDLDAYFCDPHSPWQKGCVENAIGRLRRDFPRSARRADLADAEFRGLIALHNATPRKCLAYRTPAEAFLMELKR